MRSWTQLQSNYASLTDTSSANRTLGGTFLNDSIRTICNLQGGKLRFLESTVNIKTIANKQNYPVPNKFRKVIDTYVTLGDVDSNTNTIYMPEMVFDPTKWKLILAYKFGTNDFPYFAYVQNQDIYFQPIPSSNGNTITIRGRLNTIDLSFEDYTTGTITAVPLTGTLTGALSVGATSATLNANWTLPTDTYRMIFSSGEERQVTLTNGAAIVTWTDGLDSIATTAVTIGTEEGGSIITGSGTSWTTGMAGRYIRITDTSAANGGDGFWYEIDEILSTTVLSLKKQYTGSSISAGSATYTMGQMSIIPEAYDMAIVYGAAAVYWTNKSNDAKSREYWMLYDGGNEAGLSHEYGGIIGQMLANEGETEEGAYIPPFGSQNATIMQAPYYFPYQQGSGFN